MRRLAAALPLALAAAAALPAAALAAEPGTVDAGDTAWLLVATALVMVMLPGLALFYGGLVRRKNVLSTIMHSFFGLALVSVVWVIVGFSIAFAPDATGLGLFGASTSSSSTASGWSRPPAARSRSSCSPPSS